MHKTSSVNVVMCNRKMTMMTVPCFIRNIIVNYRPISLVRGSLHETKVTSVETFSVFCYLNLINKYMYIYCYNCYDYYRAVP